MNRITTCPTCGSKRIQLVKRTVHRTFRGKPFTVPNLAFHECPNCGEVVFDTAAMDKIAAHRPRIKKKAVA